MSAAGGQGLVFTGVLQASWEPWDPRVGTEHTSPDPTRGWQRSRRGTSFAVLRWVLPLDPIRQQPLNSALPKHTIFLYFLIGFLIIFPRFYWDIIDIRHCMGSRRAGWRFDLQVLCNDGCCKISRHPPSLTDTIKRRKRKKKGNLFFFFFFLWWEPLGLTLEQFWFYHSEC